MNNVKFTRQMGIMFKFSGAEFFYFFILHFLFLFLSLFDHIFGSVNEYSHSPVSPFRSHENAMFLLIVIFALLSRADAQIVSLVTGISGGVGGMGGFLDGPLDEAKYSFPAAVTVITAAGDLNRCSWSLTRETTAFE